jgi:biotin carboxyl carrier protein
LLAETEKEVLLLELFPTVAKDYLTRTKCALHAAESEKLAAENAAAEAARRAAEPVVETIPITGHTIDAPLPGRILNFLVKPGDAVTAQTDLFMLEAMKMENSIAAERAGVVKRLLVNVGDNVAAGEPIIELE